MRVQGPTAVTKQLFSEIALLAPNGEAPRKGGANKASLLLLLAGKPRSAGLLDSGRNTEKKILNVCTWNVRTLLDRVESERMVRRTAVVGKELERLNIDVAALQETRFEGSGSLKEKTHTIFWSGVKEGERKQAGVAFAIRNDLARKMTESPKNISERITSLRLPLVDERFVTLICVYAPTMTHTDAVREEFYRQLSESLRAAPEADKVVLLVDFNARVGKDHRTYGPALGQFGKGNCNSNGELLINLCTQHNLVITNTYFYQPDHRYYSWKHPRSKHYHLLDYVITKNEHKTEVLNTRAMRGAECGTDHHLVKSRLRLQIIPRIRRTAPKPPRKLNVINLKNPETKRRLQRKISTAVQETEQSQNVENSWNALKKVVLETSETVLGYQKRKHQDWFEEKMDKVDEILEFRRKRHEISLAKATRGNEEEFKKAKAISQRKSRELKDEWWSEKARKLEDLAACNDTKGFYNGLKEIYGLRANTIAPIKNKDETELITENDRIIERWKEHFKDLLNIEGTIEEEILNNLQREPAVPELDEEISMEELEKAIRSMSDGKSPGIDGIPSEVYKHAGDHIKAKLLELFNLCLNNGEVPQEFKDALIVTIYKKGDKTNCGNYRGISLLCTAGKIFSKLLLNRLKILAERVLPDSQSGFRSNRSTQDMIFCIRQVQEKSTEQDRDLFLVFFDFKKAFDMVRREMLWKVLTILGCPPKFVQIAKSFHQGMFGKVSVSGNISDPFEINNGVKQGDPSAPTYFTLFLAAILKVMNQELEGGVKIISRSDGKLFNLARLKAKTKVNESCVLEFLYADDSAMVSDSLEGIQEISTTFSRVSKAFGLQINIGKTELIYQPCSRNRNRVQPVVTIDNIPLKTVSKFKYLGSHLSNDNKVDEEISHRIQSATVSFGKLNKRLWYNHDISLTTKLKVFKTAVLSALLYATETLTLHRKHIKRLTNFQLRHLRQLLKIQWSDKVPNVEVLRRAGMPSVEANIISSQLRWTGHVVRMNDSRLPKQLLYGELKEGKRKVGGQKLRYKDTIKRHLKRIDCDTNTWEERARDRKIWRAVVKGAVKRVEDKREEEFQLRHQARHEELVSNITCARCGRSFLSNAGRALHVRANKC